MWLKVCACETNLILMFVCRVVCMIKIILMCEDVLILSYFIVRNNTKNRPVVFSTQRNYRKSKNQETILYITFICSFLNFFLCQKHIRIKITYKTFLYVPNVRERDRVTIRKYATLTAMNSCYKQCFTYIDISCSCSNFETICAYGPSGTRIVRPSQVTSFSPCAGCHGSSVKIEIIRTHKEEEEEKFWLILTDEAPWRNWYLLCRKPFAQESH